jgi:hypothetical protein
VTFTVIYPAAPARIRVHPAAISLAATGNVKPPHGGITAKNGATGLSDMAG